MSNFCPHCGIAVTENSAKNCLSCGKSLSGISETTKDNSSNDPKEKLISFVKNVKDLSIKASSDLRSEETKAKMKDFANQAQRFATEKTKDLKDELGKINEARKQATEATDFVGSENKKAAVKNGIKIFWQKLTGKQKGIIVSVFLLTIFLLTSFLGNDEKSSVPLVSRGIGNTTNSNSQVPYTNTYARCVDKYQQEIEWCSGAVERAKAKCSYENRFGDRPGCYDSINSVAQDSLKCIHLAQEKQAQCK